MIKYVHIKCSSGTLHLEQVIGRKEDKSERNEKGNCKRKKIILAEPDDLGFPIPSHIVGNVIRKMCGQKPIPYNIKLESKREILEPFLKRLRREPINLAIDDISNKSFVKYITPQTIPAPERICGSKEDKLEPHLTGETSFKILNEDGTESTIVFLAVLDWNIFKRRFGRNKGALKLFFDFFSKYVKDFSYNGSLKETIYELSKKWNTIEYKKDFSSLFENLKKNCKVVSLTGLDLLFDYYWRVLKDETKETKDRIGSGSVHCRKQNSRLFITQTAPLRIQKINAELIIPFDMDNEYQSKLYQQLICGNGMSSFLGDGCAYVINCDKKTNKISIENDGYQKISESYNLQIGKTQKDM